MPKDGTFKGHTIEPVVKRERERERQTEREGDRERER